MKDLTKLSKDELIIKIKALQEKLTESKSNEKKYGIVYEIAPIPYQSLNNKGSLLDVNPKWLEKFGYSREEVIGKYFGNFLHPDHIIQFKNFFSELKKRGYINNIKFDIKNKNGTFISISCEGIASYNSKGEFEQTHCILKDITKKKVAEKVITDSQMIYKSLFYNNHSVMLIIDPENGNIIDANPAAANFYGWTITELKSMRIHQINQLSKKQVDIEMNNAKLNKKNHFYFKHKLANKEIRDVEVYSSPINIDGKNLLYSIINDVTSYNQTLLKLNESKTKYKLLADFTYDFEFWIDQYGKYIYISPACERITGYSREELTKNPNLFFNLVKKEYKETVINHYKDENNRNSSISKIIFPIITKNKEEKWIEHNCRPVFNDAGNYYGRRGNNRDITEQYKATENLRKEQELLQKLFDTIPVMITIYKPSINDFSVNKEFEKCIGYSTEEVQNIDLMEKCYPDPAYRKKAVEFMTSMSPEWGDFEIVTKSGKIIQSSWRNILLTDNTQIGIGIDISEREQVKNKLVRSEKKFRSVLENIQLIGVMLDKKANIIFANDYILNLTGWKREEILGKNWFDIFIDDKIKDEAKNVFEKTIDNNIATSSYINEILTKKGEKRIISWSNITHYSDSNRPILVTTIGEDITEQKKAEKELEKYRIHLEELVKERTEDLEAANEELKAQNEEQLTMVEELDEANKELERLNKLFVGREFRIKELRDEIEKLKKMNGER